MELRHYTICGVRRCLSDQINAVFTPPRLKYPAVMEMDLLFILLTAALFVATLGLAVLCDRLMERKS